MKQKQLFVLPLLLGLVILFFNRLALTNLILARGDTFLYFYPYWSAAAEALQAGRLPLWNPDLFMGAPFLANSQVGFFYPLNWPLWLLLPTPYAVSATIVLHVAIAAVGMFFVGRRLLGLPTSAALFTAVSFALSGYLTAQVEHVNQLQGMAWLSWFFVVLGDWRTGGWRLSLRRGWWLAVLFALQLFAGHTQTTFITIVCLAIFLAVFFIGPHAERVADGKQWSTRSTSYLFPFLLGGSVALLLTAVQLIPTIELSQLSSRQGGLTVNEALSFSWNPLLAAQSLLPAYNQSLFSEYVAFLPLTVLLLAVVGAWQWRRETAVFALLLLVMVSLLLALGQFNPLNWLLARFPGFNLFRAPARWLLLYTFGTTLLAGRGLVRVSEVELSKWGGELKRPLFLAASLLGLLMLWGFASRFLTALIPTGAEAPYQPISVLTASLWLLELIVVVACLLALRQRLKFVASGLIIVSLIVIFISSRSLPYNNPTTPEAFFDLRPPTTRLQAQTQAQMPPDRFLSLSHIFFDPGDQAEIDTIYADLLPEQARFDYTVAIKQKEIIGPNLSLLYGLPTVDGFDGGILPLASYSQLVRTTLLNGQSTTDGRLREFLTAVPAAHWLDLLNVRYLITDKVGDQWREGIFFDLQHPTLLRDEGSLAVGYIPSFEATELWLIAPEGSGEVVVKTAVSSWQLTPQQIDGDLYQVLFPQPATPTAIELLNGSNWHVQGLTLVDGRDDAFQSLVLGDYRLIHSGDVKIYENLDVLPRAYAVTDWQTAVSFPAALEQLTQFDDPIATAVVTTETALPQLVESSETASIRITDYMPERVVVATESTIPFLLVLSDVFYPGWQVTIDGEPATPYATNALFRGVFVPEGSHKVVWTYAGVELGTWGINGRFISIVAWILWTIMGVGLWYIRSR